MTLPTLLFAEKGMGWFEARENVPNLVIYHVRELVNVKTWWPAYAYSSDMTRRIPLGTYPTLDAAFKACEAHFIRQSPP